MSPRASIGIVLAAVQATRQKTHIIGRANFRRIVEPFFPQFLSCLWLIIPTSILMRRGCVGQLRVRSLPARHAENAFFLHSILEKLMAMLVPAEARSEISYKCLGLRCFTDCAGSDVNGRDETKCRPVGTCPDVATKWFMILRSPTENENAAFVIPAWIAGIQVRKDASEDVHVTLINMKAMNTVASVVKMRGRGGE